MPMEVSACCAERVRFTLQGPVHLEGASRPRLIRQVRNKLMVTASAIAASSSHLLGRVNGLLTLRVRSPEHRGRVVRIRSPKCVVGSHPSCTLRLRGAGVRPFHCLILRGEAGTFIRRLSAETCLNGAGFADTRLIPGDRLAIGPIELEVLELNRNRRS